MSDPIKTPKGGFTLIELLVVIVIITIMAALIFPAIHNLSDRAKAVNCAAGIRQFGEAALLYRSEHNGFLPPGHLIPPMTLDNFNPRGDANANAELLDGGYLETLPYCPSSRVTAQGRAYIQARGISEKQHFQSLGSYVMNQFVSQTKIEALPGPYWGGFPYPGDSKMLFVTEAVGATAGFIWASSQYNLALNGIDYGNVFIRPRNHGNHRLNFMFLDGHVELLGPKVTGTDVSGRNTYDWSAVFDPWGFDGKYIDARQAFNF